MSIQEQNPFVLPEGRSLYEPERQSFQPKTFARDSIHPPASTGDVVLSVQGLSKKFCRSLKRSLFYGLQDIAAEITNTRRSDELRPKEFWALKDVSLNLHQGQALGLIGANGSGKTTLLRIISGLIKPDTGRVQVRGRIAPLIALGAGFSPVLTGRENIYANMSILGLSSTEINRLIDQVVDFAEISGDALEAPVQSYSSGMAARLGFACAIHTHPDILLIDEVLVVGDVRFKIKCYRKLHELRQAGTSFIMVSHSSGMISTICQEAVYLRQGECITYGDAMSVINRYEEDLCFGQSQAVLGSVDLPPKSEAESMGLDIQSVFFRDANGRQIDSPTSGELVYLAIECKCSIETDEVSLVIDIREMAGEGETLLYMNSADENTFLRITPGTCEIQVQMPAFGLGLGLYDARIAIRMQKLCLLDKLESFKFAVKKSPEQSNNSLFYQSRKWLVSKSRT